MPITPVVHSGQTYAIFVTGKPEVEGAKFITDHTEEFQIGIMERPAGHQVKPHRHPERSELIRNVSEFLYIQEGAAEVTVFDDQWAPLHKQKVAAGDFLVFFRGGHALTMLQETRLIEVKQGPFPGDKEGKEYR